MLRFKAVVVLTMATLLIFGNTTAVWLILGLLVLRWFAIGRKAWR